MPVTLPPDFSASRCAALLGAGQSRALSETLLAALDSLAVHAGGELEPGELNALDGFCLILMTCLASPDFVIAESDLASRWIWHNRTIVGLLGASSFGSAEPALRIALGQPDNLVKALTLYSCAVSQGLDLSPVFDSHPEATSLWWLSALACDYASLTVGAAADRVAGHLAAIPERMMALPGHMTRPYFFVTYAAPEAERKVKAAINRMVKPLVEAKMAALPPRPKPDPRHVAVISSLWATDHAVYRTNARFVDALRGRYRLTLVTNHNPGIDTDGFDRVIRLGPGPDFTPLADLDAMVAFFPDVGMGEDSIMLANARLAPIQIMSCGHPVSSFGAEMDYFLSGDEVDDDETAAKFYSERLILIPGRGVVANSIPSPRRFQDKPTEGPVRIGLSWSMPKINRQTLAALRAVADHCPRPVEYHLFAGTGMGSFALPILRRRLTEILGEGRFVLHPILSQEEYLEAMSTMHAAADSHPFGGFNVVVDALHMGVPVVAFEGERAFSRYGAHLMRGLGLGGLVATDHQSYAEILLRLAADEDWRRDWDARIRALDLDATVYAEDNARHFGAAVDHLIEAHQPGVRLPPIRIGRGP